MADTPGAVRACVVGMTDVGRVREHNEDSFLVVNLADGHRTASAERLDAAVEGAILLAVCDGMGGAAAGEVASRMAADRLAADLGKADFAASSPDQIAALMDKAVQQGNTDIHAAAAANPSQKGMGTTMTAAVVTPGRIFVSQVGDSRAYLLRKSLLNQITKDQSLIGQLIEEGTLTEEEAEKLGGRNIVLQAVGVEENLRVDTKYWPILRGDVLLLCSDGLSGMVKDVRIKEILTSVGDDVRRAAEELVAEANKNGGRDNVTAIVARFDGDGLRPPMESAESAEVDRAGVAFKAPPPPEVENPMRRMAWLGVAVLALIGALFLALHRTTTEVQVSTEPADLPVHVKLLAPDGTPYEADAREGLATLKDVKPSDKQFLLTASVPGDKYEIDEQKVDIRTAGTATLTAAPVPKRGTVKVRSKTPRVRVRIEAPGSHSRVNPYDKTEELPEADKEREFTKIPAGKVKVTATRPGFRSAAKEERLEPMGSVVFDLPELQPITGTLVVGRSQDGAQVEVLDEHGEALARGEVKGGEARLANVRVGKQTVRVSQAGFKTFETDVEVAEGGEARVDAVLEVERIQCRFRGPAGAEFEVHAAEQGEGEPLHYGKADGLRPWPLAPGNYRVKWRVGNTEWKSKEFAVKVGDKPKDVELP
jgi:serine/threonine protein phosphatase PrpC